MHRALHGWSGVFRLRICEPECMEARPPTASEHAEPLRGRARESDANLVRGWPDADAG